MVRVGWDATSRNTAPTAFERRGRPLLRRDSSGCLLAVPDAIVCGDDHELPMEGIGRAEQRGRGCRVVCLRVVGDPVDVFAVEMDAAQDARPFMRHRCRRSELAQFLELGAVVDRDLWEHPRELFAGLDGYGRASCACFRRSRSPGRPALPASVVCPLRPFRRPLGRWLSPLWLSPQSPRLCASSLIWTIRRSRRSPAPLLRMPAWRGMKITSLSLPRVWLRLSESRRNFTGRDAHSSNKLAALPRTDATVASSLATVSALGGCGRRAGWRSPSHTCEEQKRSRSSWPAPSVGRQPAGRLRSRQWRSPAS